MSSTAYNTTEFPNQPPPRLDALCTLATCPLTRSIFKYQPDLTMALAPLVIFAILGIGHIVVGWRYKTKSFMVAMVLGCILEAVGYIGRVLAHYQPFGLTNYLLQICLLTLSPVFFCAGIYLCLGKIVTICGGSVSRIAPVWYTRIFLSCDFISLVLQASGGALASSATTQSGSNMGVNIMLGGLCFQVATLALFSYLSLEFAYRFHKHPEAANQETAALRQSLKWKLFLIALSTATVLILIRSLYRVVEMAGGYDGPLMKNQITFLIFEGVLVLISVVILLVFHPGTCVGPFWHYSAGSNAKPFNTTSSHESISESASKIVA